MWLCQTVRDHTQHANESAPSQSVEESKGKYMGIEKSIEPGYLIDFVDDLLSKPSVQAEPSSTLHQAWMLEHGCSRGNKG
jgi:hypothetical protein